MKGSPLGHSGTANTTTAEASTKSRYPLPLMASVCCYFQVHQPFRLRRYSVFDEDPFYFDNDANREILLKVTEKCYRPATAKILDLVKRHEGRFRASFSITGTCLEQLELWAPDVIDLFKALADTGACEFINETSHHSLSFLFARDEFDHQVDVHRAQIEKLFGQTPRIFRNTELIYHNDLAYHIANRSQHEAIICEGVDRLLEYRSPNYLYVPPRFEGQHDTLDDRPIKLLLKNYRLSDDIAFRFSNRDWKDWPLSAEKFASWVNDINGDGRMCNLFMDYETLGEHQWADTGIFEFLDALPEMTFSRPLKCLIRTNPWVNMPFQTGLHGQIPNEISLRGLEIHFKTMPSLSCTHSLKR
jgi:alpha-amylase